MDHIREYNIIKKFYGERTATRSGVPLMNHIDEGLMILENIGAPLICKKAFCLHPLVQMSVGGEVWKGDYCDDEVLALTSEYAIKANSYLCKPETDFVQDDLGIYYLIGDMSENCALMLYADKTQNYKDFMLYHSDTHRRSVQLYRYFNLWLNYLVRLMRGD